MKTAIAVELDVLKSEEVQHAPTHEVLVPPWIGWSNHRLKWWLTWLVTKSSMVRLVGPNERPLERHEFEKAYKYESLRNRVL